MDTRYAEPHDIPARMRDFCDWLNSETAQALPTVEYVSLAIIRMRDRDQYLDALATAASGNFTPLQNLVAEAIAESCRRAISFFS
jgi:hypothetical protein